jgi:hypothetical protein
VSSIAVDAGGNAFVGGSGKISKIGPSGASLSAVLTFVSATIPAVALEAAGNSCCGRDRFFTRRPRFHRRIRLRCRWGSIQFNTPIPATPSALALDGGNIYVVGSTQTTSHGTDAFLLKLSAAWRLRHLLYSMNVGGSGNDSGRAIAVNAQGEAYVVGDTLSSDFPLVNAAKRSSAA